MTIPEANNSVLTSFLPGFEETQKCNAASETHLRFAFDCPSLDACKHPGHGAAQNAKATTVPGAIKLPTSFTPSDPKFTTDKKHLLKKKKRVMLLCMALHRPRYFTETPVLIEQLQKKMPLRQPLVVFALSGRNLLKHFCNFYSMFVVFCSNKNIKNTTTGFSVGRRGRVNTLIAETSL